MDNLKKMWVMIKKMWVVVKIWAKVTLLPLLKKAWIQIADALIILLEKSKK